MPRNIYHINSRVQKKSLTGVYLVVIAIVALLVLIAARNYTISNVGQIDRLKSGIIASYVQDLNFELEKPEVNPNWPKKIQSATGALGYGVLAQSNDNPESLPMASLAKVMAAILIIEADQITLDNPGDEIVFTVDDEALYNKYLLEDGVVTNVKSGNSIAQREALKAMLMSSSNNIADTAIIWTFGSINNYLEAANAKAAELGMQNTTFADVTGFSEESKSTAADLVLLAEYAMSNALFSSIVSTWQTTILDDVKITNTNMFLDYENNGVIGVKTGLTDEAGGTYMAAAIDKTDEGESFVAIAVILGAKTHFGAQEAAMPLIKAVSDGFNSKEN